jgi:hypothetical protein
MGAGGLAPDFIMLKMQNRCYDPETVELLRTALDEAWGTLAPAKQVLISKSDLAERVLLLAATGERDPGRLRAAALSGIEARG